jgi:outer membrane cobalamin receptor
MKIDGTTLRAVPCFMSVMVDGLMMTGEIDGHFDLAHLPLTEDIHGIEVFAGAASVPPKYNGAANDKMCGLIAIWTR